MPNRSRTATFLAPVPRALLVLVILVLVAAWPVYALSGGEGLLALGIAAAVSFAGFLLGRAPHLFLTQGPDAVFHASLAGLGIRLLGTLSLAAPLMLFSGLPLTPFAVGLVLSYFALLVVEVIDLVRAGQGISTTDLVGRDEAHSGTDGAPTR